MTVTVKHVVGGRNKQVLPQWICLRCNILFDNMGSVIFFECKEKMPLASLYRIKPVWQIFHWLYTVQYVHCTLYTRYTDLRISSIIASDGYLRSLRTSFSTQNLKKYALNAYLEVRSFQKSSLQAKKEF